MCVSGKIISENEIGIGDEVFLTGLFRHHFGSRKNIPIVRVGNLAALTEKKVATRDYGLIDAYLIEARSIGGISGSPVFVNLGVTRSIGGTVKHSQRGPIFYLLGLVHGHYDINENEIDSATLDAEDALTPAKVNMGIAIVVPVKKILEVIEGNEVPAITESS
jgi:hypothetical protein